MAAGRIVVVDTPQAARIRKHKAAGISERTRNVYPRLPPVHFSVSFADVWLLIPSVNL